MGITKHILPADSQASPDTHPRARYLPHGYHLRHLLKLECLLVHNEAVLRQYGVGRWAALLWVQANAARCHEKSRRRG